MYKILPYYGFGNNKEVIFRGRVVKDNGYEKHKQQDGFFNDLIGFWKRFAVQPVAKQKVTIEFDTIVKEVATNEYGIFEVIFDPNNTDNDRWLVAQASIKLAEKVIVANLTSISDVSGNDFGIISDIDDTVLISNATKKISLVYLTVFKKPTERTAFEGVAELYNQLVLGPSGECSNPIFYVSSSHWNLFDLITEFMETQQLPKGPLLLKKVKGVKDMMLTTGNHDHKKEKVIEVLETYPELQFVLIGDSGQRDAAIYASIAREFPNRIKAILLRDVTNYPDPIVEQSISVVPDSIAFKVFSNQEEAIEIVNNLGLVKPD